MNTVTVPVILSLPKVKYWYNKSLLYNRSTIRRWEKWRASEQWNVHHKGSRSFYSPPRPEVHLFHRRTVIIHSKITFSESTLQRVFTFISGATGEDTYKNGSIFAHARDSYTGVLCLHYLHITWSFRGSGELYCLYDYGAEVNTPEWLNGVVV